MSPGFYAQPVVDLARALIGCRLLVDGVGGTIVETEAYHAGDAASHSFAGPRPRTAAMFGAKGRAYVYRSYGLHWCMNVVGGAEMAAAVLLRAIEPTDGVAAMIARRGLSDPRLLCAGPGRLCQALGITDALDGAALDAPPFSLLPCEGEAPAVLVGPRIGITKAVAEPWRFGLAGSRFLSKPFR
ncbi:DNA-3-methyladenine glycosylase [Sphingomonas sp. KR1UV-12]|uniref:Putative 3-methyladenine DNA glycosylase n=1 Tax=Sphingomonas aurea TaxID=3063994 RepID=A0ABT9ENK3_9SPHN|nr:DNA-3-methyladenine glycosylase [Sphingomonas sp. KR1UV-12]MDP1028417.1 DNA-3-methyladenine glycosylase [Sphingomonas sp. KR1UV-12]